MFSPFATRIEQDQEQGEKGRKARQAAGLRMQHRGVQVRQVQPGLYDEKSEEKARFTGAQDLN